MQAVRCAALGLALLVSVGACGSPSVTPPASPDESGSVDAATPAATPASTPHSAAPEESQSTGGADPATFAYDAGRPLAPTVTRTRETGKTRLEHVTYVAHDGEDVPALLALPRDRRGPFPCIVLGHGYRGDKSWPQVFDLLAAAGFASFAIDARFHGERRDPRALADVATDPALLARMLRETVIDMRRGIDYLETRPECDPARIGYLGASMGGFIGSMLAGADERIQAPVLLVSGGDWETMLESTEAQQLRRIATPDLIRRARAVLDPIDPIHWVGRISPRPVLMIAGDADRSVPPASARALHEAAREPKKVIWYRGGHAIPDEREAQRVFAEIGLWLVEHLGDRSG